MGMCTYLELYKDLPASLQTILKIRDACDQAKISYPKEVNEILSKLEEVHDSKKLISVGSVSYDHRSPHTSHEGISCWQDNGRQGFEIALDELPKEVKLIRFINSW